MKIITTNAPSHGDHHGCPFKHFGKPALQQYLLSTPGPGGRINEGNVNEVLNLVQQGHFQIACTKYYELTRKP
jgi:DNA primase large subunit